MGTGLGLAIVQSDRERSFWQISVESAPGHAGDFRIELPVRPPGAWKVMMLGKIQRRTGTNISRTAALVITLDAGFRNMDRKLEKLE